MLMTERIEHHTAITDITDLHKKHESNMHCFRESKAYFDFLVQDLNSGLKTELKKLFKTAVNLDIGHFKRESENPVSERLVEELSKLFFPDMEEYMMLHKQDEVESYKEKTKQFLLEYANLYAGYINWIETYYDLEKFRDALELLTDHEHAVCKSYQDLTSVHISSIEEKEEVIRLLNSAIDKLSSESELDVSKEKTMSLLQYHFNTVKAVA